MSWTRKSLCFTLFQSSPFLESSQWSLSEILGRFPAECAHNSPTHSPTAPQAPATAVLCGMSTHGLWAGPARRNFLILPSKHMLARAAAAQFTHARARRRRTIYSFGSTFDVINCAQPRKCAQMQPGSVLIGSRSEHKDRSIGAHLPHSTGCLVWCCIAFDKKLVD